MDRGFSLGLSPALWKYSVELAFYFDELAKCGVCGVCGVVLAVWCYSVVLTHRPMFTSGVVGRGNDITFGLLRGFSLGLSQA